MKVLPHSYILAENFSAQAVRVEVPERDEEIILVFRPIPNFERPAQKEAA
jgi:hypothetical protein